MFLFARVKEERDRERERDGHEDSIPHSHGPSCFAIRLFFFLCEAQVWVGHTSSSTGRCSGGGGFQ